MRTVMVVILIMLALMLVACGGGDDGTSNAMTTEEGAAAETATPVPLPTATPWPTLPPTRDISRDSHQGHIYTDGTTTIHTVQAGETLGQIANLYSIPIDIIANANRIYDRDSVDVGEILFIPPCE